MAINDKNDKQIQDLLENNYPLKAIKVDFNDLNNKTFIIKTAFSEGYKKLENFSDWYYIVKLNLIGNCIDLIGLVSFEFDEQHFLKLNWIETNKVFKKKMFSKEILDYLKLYVKWIHAKGIKVKNYENNIVLFKLNDFKLDKGAMVWQIGY